MATILVVEDNEMNLDMLSRRLSKRGHEVLIATDGAQGVDMAQRHKPNLILMDMSLPVMDGWQATRLIKSDSAIKHIPIIALTAHAIAGDREKCLAAGCDEYETKPIKFPELLAKIDQFLGISNE
ncbi:MAG: response regulator [Anaerolineae bacterium]|jgi:CheY-like chemotaxis protein|nr:response regulator [Anaerolineae bacterium]